MTAAPPPGSKSRDSQSQTVRKLLPYHALLPVQKIIGLELEARWTAARLRTPGETNCSTAAEDG